MSESTYSNTSNLSSAHRALETQGGHPGRGLQGMRPTAGGGHARAGNAGGRRRRRLRHGRSVAAADLAVYADVRQAHRRLAAGRRSAARQGHAHRQPAETVPGGVRPVQAVPAREAAQSHHLPRHRSRFAAQVCVAQIAATGVRRHQHAAAHRRRRLSQAAGDVRGGIHRAEQVRVPGKAEALMRATSRRHTHAQIHLLFQNSQVRRV